MTDKLAKTLRGESTTHVFRLDRRRARTGQSLLVGSPPTDSTPACATSNGPRPPIGAFSYTFFTAIAAGKLSREEK